MSWNRVSVPPASLESLHMSWYREHLETSPNSTQSHFLVEWVNKKTSLCHCRRRAPYRANTWYCWLSYSSFPVLSSCPQSPSDAFPASEPSKPHCKGHPTGNAEPRGNWNASSSQGATSSEGHDHPSAPVWTQPWGKRHNLSDDSNVWLSHSSLHTPPLGQPGLMFLLALHFSLPFFVLLWQVRKMFSSHLLSHCHSPKKQSCPELLFPRSCQAHPSIHPSFLGSYRLQLVARTINTINNFFLTWDLLKLQGPIHLTHFTTYVLQIHTLQGISQPSMMQAELLAPAEKHHRQTSGCPAQIS